MFRILAHLQSWEGVLEGSEHLLMLLAEPDRLEIKH
jgi:hypothetical protein